MWSRCDVYFVEDVCSSAAIRPDQLFNCYCSSLAFHGHGQPCFTLYFLLHISYIFIGYFLLAIFICNFYSNSYPERYELLYLIGNKILLHLIWNKISCEYSEGDFLSFNPEKISLHFIPKEILLNQDLIQHKIELHPIPKTSLTGASFKNVAQC